MPGAGTFGPLCVFMRAWEKGEAVEAFDGFLAMFGMAGHWELVIIGGVILLVFFGRRIPEVMRSLGQGVTQFKKGLREDEGDAADGEGAAPSTKSLPAPEREVEVEGTKQAEPAEAPPKRNQG